MAEGRSSRGCLGSVTGLSLMWVALCCCGREGYSPRVRSWLLWPNASEGFPSELSFTGDGGRPGACDLPDWTAGAYTEEVLRPDPRARRCTVASPVGAALGCVRLHADRGPTLSESERRWVVCYGEGSEVCEGFVRAYIGDHAMRHPSEEHFEEGPWGLDWRSAGEFAEWRAWPRGVHGELSCVFQFGVVDWL